MSRRAAEVVRSVVDRLTANTSRGTLNLGPPSHDEATLHRILGHVPGIAFRCRADRARTMDFVSRGSGVLTGFEPRDLVHNRVVSYGSLIHPDDRGRVQEELYQAVVSRRPYHVVYRIRRVDGQVRKVRECGQAVTSDSLGVAIEGCIADITEQLELLARVTEQEAREAARIEALRARVLSLAHDLNNSLGVIKATAQVLLIERAGDAALEKDVAEILSAVDRSSGHHRQLTTLVH